MDHVRGSSNSENRHVIKAKRIHAHVHFHVDMQQYDRDYFCLEVGKKAKELQSRTTYIHSVNV
jgi:hypothetical protein